MARSNGQHDNPITEHELLEWVEGTLSPQRESAVLRALANDTELARFMEQLRDDRVALASVPDEPIPAHVAERLSETVERQLLLGTVEEGPVLSDIPRNRKTTVRRSVFGDTTGRLLLVAAVVLIAVGAAAYFASVGLSGFERPSLPEQRELATNPPPVAVEPDVEETIAMDEQPDETPDPAPVEEVELAQAQEPTPPAPPMTTERAMELLAQGRLALRVQTDTPARAVTKMGRLAQRGDELPGRWRVRQDVPETLVSAMRPMGVDAFDQRVRAMLTAMADDGGEAPTVEARPVDTPVITGVYALDIEPTETELDTALAALRSQLGQQVELIELEEPVVVPSSVEVRSILWWGRGPEAWVKRVSVPVVVEEE